MFKNSFAKNIAIIASGAAGAQIINTILSPVITRIYTPEEYGIFTVFTSLLGMIVIIGSLRYEWGIPISKNNSKAINLLVLSLLILLAFTGILTIVLIVWADDILRIIDSEIILKYIYFLPVGVLFAGLYNIFMQWALRHKDYRSISKTKINQSLVQNLLKIIFGILHLGPVGLIMGGVLGQGSGTITLASPVIKEWKNVLKVVNKKNLLEALKRYIKFPLYSAPSQLLNTAGLQLPVLLLAAMYGSATSGYYALAHTIVNIPMVLIGGAVADVFYGEAATIGRTNPKALKNLLKKLFKKLVYLGLIPLVLLILTGPELFSLVFGDHWYEAGVFSRIISFLVFSRFIFTPFGRVFSVFEKQSSELILDCLRLILVLGVFTFAHINNLNSYLTIGLYTCSMCLIYLITFCFVNKIINDEIKETK